MNTYALAASVRLLRDRLAVHDGTEPTDEQLLDAFLAHHDESAFAGIVRRHGSMVLQVCRRILGHQQDAEDAFQATFLVLARQGAALRNKAALGSFLHGVAHRTSLKVKQAAMRRQHHEGRAPQRRSTEPVDDLSWREVRRLLDEEIARLPEASRSVFVLCCLENLSQVEAARRLGMKERTLSSRLAVARRRLQKRLARRGVELTGVLAAAAVATGSATALPAGLMARMVGASVPVAAGEALSGVVPAHIAELIRIGASALGLTKAKNVALSLVILATLLGASALAYQATAVDHTAATASGAEVLSDNRAVPRHLAATTPNPEERVTIEGRVLAPEGQPMAGARIVLLGMSDKPADLGVAQADGRFMVRVPRKVLNQQDCYLVAQAPGTGLDFIDFAHLKPGQTAELRLVPDHAIRGRVVSTEGKPLPGVRVNVEEINVHIGNSLDSFLNAYIKILAGGKGSAILKRIWRARAPLPGVTTDGDGRFELRGLGAERTIRLQLSGGGIAAKSVQVVNRAGIDPSPYNKQFRDYYALANGRTDQRWMEYFFLHGPDVSAVAEAGKIIRGRVTDADTGNGQPGLVVRLSRTNDETAPAASEAKTDAAGHFEIHGIRKSRAYLVQCLDDPATGYTPSQVWVEDSAGYQPVVADLKAKKGVVVTGKVLDRATGRPVPGWAAVAVMNGNPHIKDYPQFETPSPQPYVAHSHELDAEGNFRVVTLPGPVVLMGGPDFTKLDMLEALQYKPPIADPEYPNYFRFGPGPTDELRLTYFGAGGLRGSVEGYFCKVLNPKPGTAVVRQDIILERANKLEIRIQDVEGRPLSGVWVTGISPRRSLGAVHLGRDTCPVYELDPSRPRRLVFSEPSRKLAGTRALKGDEQQPLVVRLGVTGAVEGKLQDEAGRPLVGIEIDIHYRDPEAAEIDWAIHEGKQVVTDQAGAFRLEEVIPGLPFELAYRHGRRRLEPQPQVLELKSGECQNLGTSKQRLVPDRMER
jgi:RNA polymerase sigma factor (sigma-70 family)